MAICYVVAMRHQLARFHSLILHFWLIIGLGLLAFAHPPLRSTGLDLSAYAMPDGTLPDLCIIDDGSNDPSHMAHCPACHLAAALPAPQVQSAALWVLLPFAQFAADAAQIAGHLRQFAPPPARAPPVLTV